MKSLHIDYTNYNGHQMVISGKEAFRRNELHQLELQMLSDNKVHTLLPITWLEVDDCISFHYRINGFRLIGHHLRSRQLTMQRYYSLLLSIADGLATCYDYMLRPNCCLIDEELLYIDETIEQVGIVYLPLQQQYTEQLGQRLLLLAVRWSSLVVDLDTDGYHRILQQLSNEELPIQPLRQLLLDLIHEQNQNISKNAANQNDPLVQRSAALTNTGQASLQATNFPADAAKKQEDFTQRSMKEQAMDLQSATPPGKEESDQDSRLHTMRSILAATPKPQFQHIEDLLDDDELEIDHEHSRLQLKHYLITGLVTAAIVLSWLKLYSKEQNFEQLLLCIGITIGLLALLALILLKPLKAMLASSRINEPIEFDLMTEHEIKASTSLSARQAPHWSPVLHTPESKISKLELDTKLKPLTSSAAEASALAISDNPFDKLAHQKLSEKATQRDWPQHSAAKANQLATVKLDELQATTMLNEQPMLMRMLQGEDKTIVLAEATFLIGRAEEGVHYQETAKGVSRVHLELQYNNGIVQAKDVGSRNGTFLNGQLMIAYKAYPLKTGDKLQLASLEGPLYELVGKST